MARYGEFSLRAKNVEELSLIVQMVRDDAVRLSAYWMVTVHGMWDFDLCYDEREGEWQAQYEDSSHGMCSKRFESANGLITWWEWRTKQIEQERRAMWKRKREAMVELAELDSSLSELKDGKI